VAGCSGSGAGASSYSTTTGSAAASTSQAPLTAVVDQFRDEYGTGTIILQLNNRTSTSRTLVRAELVGSDFASGTPWIGSIELPPDQPLSLPASVAAPACAYSGGTTPSVRAVFADGTSITVPATDPHDVLSRVRTEQCFASVAERAVDLRFADELQPGPSPQTAVLELIVTPPAGSPSAAATLVSVSGTTLLAEDPSAPWPHDLALSADGSRVPLTFRPARCDPHAVAEDKIGTLIPLTLRVAGQTGVVKVPASAALKAAVYAFVGRACGW
jgi:hypothetical protein